MGGDNMKKTLSILMALLLLWSMALPAAAAETAAAATLRLEKAEGTVKVSNASGKSVTVTDGMRLYSGYTIATEKNSYAYVSLDSTKAVKLDASSKAEVRKSGKKLELNAVSGSLFFNVTAPVDKDESLNIRTSTMVTGVRGTSGWVVVIDRFTSRVHLLEGTLTVTSSEPATGQMRQATITSGQTATATLKGLAQAGRQMSLTVTNLQEKQVPGFVAVEVEKDPALQGKIAAKSPLSVPAIIGDAWARLKNEQASANAADQKIQKDLNNIAADEVDQVFQNTAEDDDDDDDDDAPSVPPQPDPTPTPDPTPSDMDLDGPTAAALKAALETPGVTNVTVTNAGANDLSTESYTVSSGQTLDIRSGTFTVGSGQTLDVAGTLTNSGTLDVAGTANITGTAENSGTITITSTNSLHVAGTLTNTGTIQVGGTAALGLLDIQAGGTLNNSQSGSISVAANSTVTNNGSFANAGSLTNAGNFSVDGAGAFTCTGTYTEGRTDQLYALSKSTDGTVYYLGPASQMSGWYTGATVTLLGASSGTLSGGTVSASGAVLDLNGHTADLSSTLTIAGELKVRGGAGSGLTATTLTAAGLSNDGTLTMLDVSAACQLYNTGTMELTDCSVTVSDGYAITNYGTTAVTTIEGDSTVSSDASAALTETPVAIYNQAGAALYVKGGSISVGDGSMRGSTGIMAEGGRVTVSGGEVTNTGGTAISVFGGEVRISGGTVKGDGNSCILMSSGNLTIEKDAEVKSDGSTGIEITGGIATISGGTVTSTSSIGIEVKDNATVIISGGEISSYSAGIYMNSGTVNLSGTGKVFSTSYVGINVNAGTVTVSGGEVAGIQGGITNTQDAASVTISGGTITVTDNDPVAHKLYAVSGPFTYTGGALRAKSRGAIYDWSGFKIPSNFGIVECGDWHVLSRTALSADGLERAFETSDSVAFYSSDTIIRIEQPLTVPEGKTVIIPKGIIVKLYDVLSGPGTLVNYGTLALKANADTAIGNGSVDLTSQAPLTLINHGKLMSDSVSTVAVMDNTSKTVTYIGPAGDSTMPWSDNTTIQLMADCTKQLTSGGKNVTLDLSGHYYAAPETLTDPVLTVGTGTSLTITDSIGDAPGIAGSGSSVVTVEQGAELTVTGGVSISNMGIGAAISSNGTVTLENCSVETMEVGTAIIISGGELNMRDGSSALGMDCGISMESGTLIMEGGTITANGSGEGTFAVKLGNDAKFTFTGGVLRARGEANLCSDPSILEKNNAVDDTKESGYWILTPAEL